LIQKIIPNLWFDIEAEEAANFYISLFENSKILGINHYGEAGPRQAGSVLTVHFELNGQEFIAINGGPEFKFNQAISFQVSCKDQAEVDRLWNQLTAGGQEQPCGWLKDRYGLSWQIIPQGLSDLIANPDPAGSARAVREMFTMKKIDLARIRKAFDGQ
jgi:predicted 3-demethylubiquinone-9 3-methyltransferase (glyoxalase superfamily)